MEKKVVIVISLILVIFLAFSLVWDKITEKISDENVTNFSSPSSANIINATSNISSSEQETPSTAGDTSTDEQGIEEESEEQTLNTTNETIPETITENYTSNETTSATTTATEENYTCEGCELENECYPIGHRKFEQYCSSNYEFVNQLESDSSCENNFECESNICAGGKCISQGLVQRIVEWFKELFI